MGRLLFIGAFATVNHNVGSNAHVLCSFLSLFSSYIILILGSCLALDFI